MTSVATLTKDSFIESLVQERQILYLSREDVLTCGAIEYPALLPAIRAAYALHEEGAAIMPMTEYLTYPNRPSYDRIISLYGYLGGAFDVAGLKQICSATANPQRGFTRASGLLILNDVRTHRPFCILEAGVVSAARTAAVTGLALSAFAMTSDHRIAMVGCGELATAHVRMIVECFGAGRFVFQFYDVLPARQEALARHAETLGARVESAHSAQEALSQADIVIPATTAEQPWLRAQWLREGFLYSAVSLMDAELDVYYRARSIVVDDLKQCLHAGRPLQRMHLAGNLPEDKVVSFGSWLKSPVPLERPCVFNPMGTVITDLAVGCCAFEKAMRARIGTRLAV